VHQVAGDKQKTLLAQRKDLVSIFGVNALLLRVLQNYDLVFPA
jgi:hypothetical protein